MIEQLSDYVPSTELTDEQVPSRWLSVGQVKKMIKEAVREALIEHDEAKEND